MRPDLQGLVISEEYLTELMGEKPNKIRYFYTVGKPREPGDFFIKLGISVVQWIRYKSVRRIVQEVDRYNAVIRAVDINDQLEDAGNPGVGLSDRQKVLAALSLIQADLVRTLKTERILRENKKFIAQHPQLFTTNLTALATLQLSDRASEYGRVLDQALQVAVGVQEEMRKLQQRP
jgi:hypothetical protein